VNANKDCLPKGQATIYDCSKTAHKHNNFAVVHADASLPSPVMCRQTARQNERPHFLADRPHAVPLLQISRAEDNFVPPVFIAKDSSFKRTSTVGMYICPVIS
jgi:hypothetical protein